MVFLEKNSEKKVSQVLSNLVGLSTSNSNFICKKLGFQKKCILKNLDSFELEQLKNYLTNNFLLDKSLIDEMKRNVKKKIDLGIYSGKRHNLGYPVRGQRTLSNGKTQRYLHKFRFYYDSQLYSHSFFKNQRKSFKNKKIAKFKAQKKKKEEKVQQLKTEKALKRRYNNQQIYKHLVNEAQKKKKEKAAYLVKLNKIKAERKKQVDVKLVKDYKEAQKSHPYFLNIEKGKAKKNKKKDN
jgi:small subunit ribosomal protein S13